MIKPWYAKQDNRRFQRVNMPVKLMFRPVETIEHKELFALGLDYYPSSVQGKLERMISRLQTMPKPGKVKNFDFYQHWVNTFVFELKQLQQMSQMIAQGHIPDMERLATERARIRFDLNSFGPTSFMHKFLPWLLQKFDAYRQFMMSFPSFANTNGFTIASPDQLPKSSYRVDQMVEKLYGLENWHEERRLLIALYETMEVVLNSIRNMYRDLVLWYFPNKWREVPVNVSKGGVAFDAPISLPMFSKIMVKFHFADLPETLTFEGKVQSIREKGDGMRLAMNFEFPDAAMQNALQQEIQKYEVEKSLRLARQYQEQQFA